MALLRSENMEILKRVNQLQAGSPVLEISMLYTPPKFNMEPENDGFQEELPFLGTSFQVPC